MNETKLKPICKLWWFDEADIGEGVSHEVHECGLEVEHKGHCVCVICEDEDANR